jgi:hypothetical protein
VKRRGTVARVKRVTQEVVQQAAVAVTSGIDTLRDLGGNLLDRVRSEGGGGGSGGSSSGGATGGGSMGGSSGNSGSSM